MEETKTKHLFQKEEKSTEKDGKTRKKSAQEDGNGVFSPFLGMAGTPFFWYDKDSKIRKTRGGKP